MNSSPTTTQTAGSSQALGIRMRTGRGATDKFLSFDLAGEPHAIPILEVREIIRMMKITPLPHAPHYVRGVVNLRGKVIAVIDLRTKLAMAAGADTNRSSIVVVQVDREDAGHCIGLVVDQVNEVLNMPADAIEAPPDLGTGPRTLRGVGKINDRVVLVIDISSILAEDKGILVA